MAERFTVIVRVVVPALPTASVAVTRTCTFRLARNFGTSALWGSSV